MVRLQKCIVQLKRSFDYKSYCYERKSGKTIYRKHTLLCEALQRAWHEFTMDNDSVPEYDEIKIKRFTIDEVRGYKGLEDLSDDAAQEVSNTIYNLTLLSFKICQHEEFRAISKIR